MHNCRIRIGTVGDLPFLKKMLYEAVFWDPVVKRLSMDKFFAIPDIAKISYQWDKRSGDFSLIAVDEQKKSIGAVWYRFWKAENHSYGYVDDNIPELGMAVIKDYRGKGIGTELVNKICYHARKLGIEKISLSVDPNNFALKLYQKFGFIKVSESGTSWTLVKKL